MNEFMQLFIYAYYLLGGIAITFLAMRFAFEQMSTNAGLIAIGGRVLGFVVMFLALMLVMPSLFEFGVNNAMARLQSSTISRNLISLTSDAAELLAQQNSEIKPISLDDRTLAETATELRTELEAQTGIDPETPQNNGDGNSTAASAPQAPQSNTQTIRETGASKPVYAPQAAPTLSIQQVFELVAEPTATPLRGEAYIDQFLREQGIRGDSDNSGSSLSDDERNMLDNVIGGGNGGGGPQTYTVQTGDSLFKIAQRFGVSVNALCRANDLRDCNVVARGKKLVIP